MMNQKKKIALYPIFSDTLPVARYLSKYCPEIEIVELLSPPGSSVCGKDASYLDNRETFGVQVHSYTDAHVDAWEFLYVLHHDAIGITEEEYFKTVYEPMIRIARIHGREVITYPHDISNRKNDVIKSSGLDEIRGKTVIKKSGTIKKHKTFIVFIGGIIAEANAFEVFINLYGELCKKVRVVAFSSSKNAMFCGVYSLFDLLYSTSYTEEQKVFALDGLIDEKRREVNADIILIQLEEALMPYSDTQTGGFGIIPYIVSQLISPDYCICCLPFGYSSTSFLEEFARGLEGRFGYRPDRWHLSNSVVDFTTMTSIRDAGVIHLPIAEVYRVLSSTNSKVHNIGCDVNSLPLKETVEDILTSLKEYKNVASIL